MDRDHVEAILTECLQHRVDLSGQHRDIAGDRGFLVGAHERSPRVQPHPGVDGRSHFRHLQIVAADGDLVDSTGLVS